MKTKKKKTKRSAPIMMIGRAQMTKEGYIFVSPENGGEDIYVKASKTHHALNGDIVRVSVTIDHSHKGTGRHELEGEVVEILERSDKPFVGIYTMVGTQGWVAINSRSMPYDVRVDENEAADAGAQLGMKVAVQVDGWKRSAVCPFGHIVDVLGTPGNNDTEMHAILAEFNLPYRFDKTVEDAAEAISEEIGPEQMRSRKDFRETFTFTIDPADAKDFDDALSFRVLRNGNFEVGVHIADVSYYLEPGSILDKEARNRGTSVYLVDRTVPMLPEKLCNKLCSLRPGEDKLVFSTVFELTPQGEIKSQWIGRAAIRSDFRLSYEEAQEIIESGATDSELSEAILKLHAIATIYRQRAAKLGAISFDRPEMKVRVDENGKPVEVYEKRSKEANWLIEEFMLLANRTVAEWVATCGKMNGVASKRAKTFVYRIHAEPNELKLENLRVFAKSFGHKFNPKGDVSLELNRLLGEAKGKPEESALENLALRSMAKACYSTDNIGHYGLAFPFYTHFTSPIRRYPDVMVHRLLADYLEGYKSGKKDYYEAECKYASQRELVASDAERTSIKYKLVEFMQDKVGQEFNGKISGLTDWSIYVEIEPTKIEGMVHLREIKGDYFEFDEARYRIVGLRSRKVFRLGDNVRIKVKAANLESRLLDFELL